MADLHKIVFTACITLNCIFYAPARAGPTLDDHRVGLAVATPLHPRAEIPVDYSSWSLFLICNPAWIFENGDQGIETLHKQFLAFGQSIGKKNAAVLVVYNENASPSVANTDFGRSSDYCEKYKLLPSKSPYVLVTTRYPDLEPEPGSHLVVRLNGLTALSSARVLSKLADQLLVTKLNQSELRETPAGWRRVSNAFRSAITATGCYFYTVSFVVNAGTTQAELPTNSVRKGVSCDR
jgi:hypothetical protein